MKLNIEQRSPEWFKLRQSSIGASEFPILAREYLNLDITNLFNKSVSTLIKDKYNPKDYDNSAMKKGRELEPMIIQHLIDNAYCVSLEPQSDYTYQYDDNNNIIASLDGLDIFNNMPVEIKTTSKKDIDELVDYYKFQVAHQCYVTGAKEGLLVIYDINNNIYHISSIEPNHVIAKDIWLGICERFLVELNNYNNMPDGLSETIDEYFSICNQIKELENKKTFLADAIKSEYPNGVTFNKFTAKSTITKSYKYSQYFKDAGLCIDDKYVTLSSRYTITENKGE